MQDMADIPGDSIIVESVLNSTSKGLELSDPKTAALALEMMCSGFTYREIEGHTGVKFDRLVNLRARHEVAVEVRRKQLAADGHSMAEGIRMLAMEKMSQLAADPAKLDKVNIRDLMVGYQVAAEQTRIATDGNRTIIEHVSSRPTLADAVKAIEEARKALQKEAIPV